jgi:uncharacterized coiled-coil DUF342 family protein
VTGDDAWTFVTAILGDDNLGPIDPDSMRRSEIVNMIIQLREERDHLRSQLTAADTHADVMQNKRGYLRDAWLQRDLETLRQLLALTL